MWEGDERRGDNQVVTRRLLRETLQPLFDLKARVEPPLRFWEKMSDDVEEFLPALLHDEQVRQLLAGVSRTRWKRIYYLAIILGGFAGLAVVGDLAISVYLLFRVH